MKKAALLLSLFIYSLFFPLSYGENIKTKKLSVEEGKRFEKFNFKKIWGVTLYGRSCLACRQGIVCDEILDRMGKEFKLKLYDYSGKLKNERKLTSGAGPDEIKVFGFDNAWVSSSGMIYCIDDNSYLKTIDPETFKIETIVKFSNVINGYGGKYSFCWHSGTSIEQRDNRIVTSFESTGFYEDMTYYIVTYKDVFENFSVIAKAKKEKPWTWAYLKKRESYQDYYGPIRLVRNLAVDWKRGVVYFLPDIEKAEIESVDLEGKQREKYLIDIKFEKFKVEREDLNFWREYVSSEADSALKSFYKSIPYTPPHAPALMRIKVIGDWLLIITGNRNWKKGENEVLVYRLPSLKYEGSCFIPFPYLLTIKWYNNYYITKDLVEKEDGYYYSHVIYLVEEK